MLPGSGVKLCVGRCGDVARDAEQGTEGVERIEPPVEAEGEFVEVGLQVLVPDPDGGRSATFSGFRRRDRHSDHPSACRAWCPACAGEPPQRWPGDKNL